MAFIRLKYCVGACLLCLMVLGAGVARAVPFEVFVPAEANESATALRARALQEGFAVAITGAAQESLPGTLSMARQDLLQEYMLDKAGGYVLGYKELSVRREEDGLRMTLDVEVNKPALRQELKSLGVYFTSVQTLPADVEVVGLEPDLDQTLELQKLITLTGIDEVAGATPHLRLTLNGSEGWTGSFDDGTGAPRVLSHKDLTKLWTVLWAGYFQQESFQAQGTAMAELTVSGWFTPEGVYAFDEQLADWQDAVQDARLGAVDVQVSRIAANWKLVVLDRALLEERLREYLTPRGLTHRLGEPPARQ